jgi:hypothetical protein
MIDITASIIWTWVIGLLPAILIRFVFLKRPARKRFVIPFVAVWWLIQTFISGMISYSAGVEWRPSTALVIVAVISYFILRKKNKVVAVGNEAKQFFKE